MKELEERVRALEIENIGLEFQLSILLDKNKVTINEMKKYAKKCLEKFPESEKNNDIALYLKGLINGDTSSIVD